MSKYIDANYLRAEIDRIEEEARKVRVSGTNKEAIGADGKVKLCLKLKSLIDSLQQEQESVAKQFAKIVRANLSEIGKNAQSQFEQLYLEITGNKMYKGYND